MGFDCDGYEKTEYMREEKIKDTWISGRARNMGKRTDQELYRYPDIVADIKKKKLECIGQVLRM
jgi:hypothetical protein